MDKFIKEAAEHNIDISSIQGMVQRDIDYKKDIYTKLYWTKIRQIVSIITSIIIIILMAAILYMMFNILNTVEQNERNMKDLITVLLGTFQKI